MERVSIGPVGGSRGVFHCRSDADDFIWVPSGSFTQTFTQDTPESRK